MKNKEDSVSIKIQTGVYQSFRNLNNKVWYALGEFVDNAVQSYIDNKSELIKINGNDYTLIVRVELDKQGDLITIEDNAAGIGVDNYHRAFEPANIPIDATGLHEYGMGMKTAAIWLSDFWTVWTQPIREDESKEVSFDLHKVIAQKREVLEVVKNKSIGSRNHGTKLTLKRLSHNAPSGSQLNKIKKHLASIYRNFIRSGQLKLYVNNEELVYEDPEILKAPFHKNPNGENVFWKKEINYSSPDGKYSAKGFIGILEKMSTNQFNGLSLFRRGRVIVGSHDEKYRPKILCGQMGSPRYKRIFGELELEGFGVSFNKGSFVEVENLEALMAAIKLEISQKSFDLYNQAEKFVKPKTKEHNLKVAKNLVKELKKANKKDEEERKPALVVPTKKEVAEQAKKLKEVEAVCSYEDKETVRGVEYDLKQEFITDPSITNLYTLDILENTGDKMRVVYKVNLANKFFSHFERFKKKSDYKPIVAIIKSLVLAELVAPSQGTSGAGNIRINFNKFLNHF